MTGLVRAGTDTPPPSASSTTAAAAAAPVRSTERDEAAAGAPAEALTGGGGWRFHLQTLRPRRLGLRTRLLMLFVFGALLLSAFLGAAAYSFTRSSVINQRD